MPTDYLHNHKQFPDLIRIVAEQKGIDPALVEKDYWIMHCLYGLQKLGLTFELKGGTSLSCFIAGWKSCAGVRSLASTNECSRSCCR